ncbi:hydroxymethylglutaryl-CoA synthase [Prauserella flavalba]|uniref:Beta-ketoacyl-[acyl-carrier-protein] synthase III C-terminal domain-containing protein n=1 Tax=Prauserella flavalba TaxID=1477506 RepID=A0A318LPL2_9PSEU|nr:hydroxymethylglutaryl-CoA synthase [Prauserella flavalba]PXY36486.1 hypothetical protein BA062_13925 [Prauserella flavalba]
MTGLISAGVAVPATRIALADILRAWRNVPEQVVRRLGVGGRAVPGPDVDTITLAAEAAQRALTSRVDAVFLGTQTNPYATRSAAAIVADMLGLSPHVFVTDLQCADKSGTAALLSAIAWVSSGLGERALAIGADTLALHAAPGDPFEYTAGAGAAAFVVGAEDGAATVVRAASAATDTPDRYRLDGERHIRGTGSAMTATGVGLEQHVKLAFGRLGVAAEEVGHLAVSQPDAATPARIAKVLGVPGESTGAGLVADRIGDAGSASALLSLARVLDRAGSGDTVVLLSYGAGASSDAVLMRATGNAIGSGTDRELDRAISVDYPTAVRYERRYAGHERLTGTYE